jgi:hypothetical protein
MTMFSVFSNNLINWYKQSTKCQNLHLLEAYEQYKEQWLSNKYHFSMFYIQIMIPDFVEPDEAYKMSMEWASNYDLRTVEYWITKIYLLYLTIFVKKHMTLGFE